MCGQMPVVIAAKHTVGASPRVCTPVRRRLGTKSQGSRHTASLAIHGADDSGTIVSVQPSSAAVPATGLAARLTLRGLNIQYPFSQLILAGAKTIEARSYPLGHRNIARPGERLFVIETPGPGDALTDGVVLGPGPAEALER